MTSRYSSVVQRPYGDGPYLRVTEGKTDGLEVKKSLTIGYCCVDALLATYLDKKDPKKTEELDGEKKLARWELANKISKSETDDEDIDLTMGEQQLLEPLLVRKWGTDVYGHCHTAIYSNERGNGTDSDQTLG